MPRPLARPSIALILLLAGCAAKTASPPRTVAAADLNAGAEADLLEHHRHHHHGGALLLIAMTLDALGLPPDEQLRVEHLQSAMMAKLRPARLAEQDLVALLASEVEASSIDRTKVDAAIAKLAAASAAVADLAVQELDQLHAVLTPPQRLALVEKLQAHWALWKQANTGERDPVRTIADTIGLTAAQIESVRKHPALDTTAAPLRETEVAAHLDAFAKAFTSDSFEAKSVVGAASANRHMAEWGSTRLARFCEAANPILTEAQRRSLVKLMREHLTHDEGGQS